MITLIKQLPFVWVLAPLAAVALAVSRLVYTEARRWLYVADELEKIEGDLRSVAKDTAPSDPAGPDLRHFLAPVMRRPLLQPGSPRSEPPAAPPVAKQDRSVLNAPPRQQKRAKRKKRR